MKKNLFSLLWVGIILSSCGTSKKLETAQATINTLNTELATAKTQLQTNEQLIAELKSANEINSRDAAICRSNQELLRQKKEKLDRELAQRGTSIEEIERKAEKSAADLRAAGCEVEYKNARFHITVPDEFTFESGGASIKPRGREALNVVAQVMRDNPGVMATIIGNTDTDLIRVANKDNWTLSAERASNVVRVLTDIYNINPKRLIAAGRSQFNPVADNATEEGKRRNRRIEIIINPKFDRIWDLLEE